MSAVRVFRGSTVGYCFASLENWIKIRRGCATFRLATGVRGLDNLDIVNVARSFRGATARPGKSINQQLLNFCQFLELVGSVSEGLFV
jgi:hypothetical protein